MDKPINFKHVDKISFAIKPELRCDSFTFIFMFENFGKNIYKL